MTTEIPAWVDGVLQPVEKLSAHVHGLRHKAVSVFLLAGENILIQRRALGKYHTPGLWANTCCTHPNWDEAAEDCAHRRLGEELGIRNVSLHHRGTIEYRADVGKGMIEHELVDVFIGHVSPELAYRMNPDEVMDATWMDRAELTLATTKSPEIYTPWLRIYLAQHADRIFDTQAAPL